MATSRAASCCSVRCGGPRPTSIRPRRHGCQLAAVAAGNARALRPFRGAGLVAVGSVLCLDPNANPASSRRPGVRTGESHQVNPFR
jgi:hypothetical protein